VECVSATSLLVERECFAKVEVSDLDSDDLAAADLCLGVHQAGRRVVYVPDAVVVHHQHESRQGSPESQWEPAAARDQHSFVGKWEADLVAPDVRLLAFYLPQYHPIPQNDRAWGPGFTEWRNVTRARPNYAGHRQPRVPADLGYYDLRVPEIMDAQAELARRYGLTGFCYYYYWFGGTRLLEMPLERMLATGRPNAPFCLCWANENWTRRWDGGDSDVIMAQDYSDEDAVAIIADMSRYLESPDYIRVNGKPLILVYRVKDLPSFKRTSDVWRRYRRTHGIGDISIGMVESFELATEQEDPARYGCDFAVEFPTHDMHTVASVAVRDRSPAFRGSIYDYEELVLRYAAKAEPSFKRLRTVLSGWDNTARRQTDGIVLERDTPGAFQAWLEWTIRRTREQNYGDERIVFINAWNEWCEGAYLEPDMEYGHDRLQAIANAIEVTRR
jgi:lipopolysaccharide biosynthesis protein